MKNPFIRVEKYSIKMPKEVYDARHFTTKTRINRRPYIKTLDVVKLQSVLTPVVLT